MAYSFSGRVRYSEIGENGLLTLPGILNYFQDCSTFQSEEVGLGIDILKEWNPALPFALPLPRSAPKPPTEKE